MSQARAPFVIGLGVIAAANMAAADTKPNAADIKPNAAAWQPAEGAALIGTRAPEWRGLDWIQGGPLELARLRGKVVLMRFWTDGCPMCRATSPALGQLWERYRARGLVVVGIHHPKSEESKQRATVVAAARELGFAFPVATDLGWSTVRAYGVGSLFHRFTSVSVLIDRQGIIRFVHDGGEFHEGGGVGHERCNQAFAALTAALERAL